MLGLFENGDKLTMELGYPAILSRMATTARTPVPAVRAGNQFLGLTPKALRVPKIGWISDIISWRDNSSKMTQEEIDLVSLVLLGGGVFFFFFCLSKILKSHSYHEQHRRTRI